MCRDAAGSKAGRALSARAPAPRGMLGTTWHALGALPHEASTSRVGAACSWCVAPLPQQTDAEKRAAAAGGGGRLQGPRQLLR